MLWELREFLAAQLAKLEAQIHEQRGPDEDAIALCTTIYAVSSRRDET